MGPTQYLDADGVTVINVDAETPLPTLAEIDQSVPGRSNGVVIAAPYPSSAIPAGASSGNAANAVATAAAPAMGGKRFYVTGLNITASGATTGLAVAPTVTGLVGGTRTFAFVYPAGVLVQANTLALGFIPPIPAASANVAVTATLPASGSGGTNAAINIEGYYL